MLTCFFYACFQAIEDGGVACGAVLYKARAAGSRAWHGWRGYKKEADAFATASFFEEREKYEKFVYLTSIIIAQLQMIVNIIYR